METQSYEQRMLAHAERQTTALEALRNFALILLVLMALGLLGWIVVAVA